MAAPRLLPLVYLLALFGSHCQMAPAAAGATRGWDLGSGYKYRLRTTVLFREAGPPRMGGDVGFRVTGELTATAVWQDPKDPDTFLLNLQVYSPQLWIKSRKAPEPEGFVEHSSRLDEVSKERILVVWKHGEVKAVYLNPLESVSSLNLKRGLASLFQYRTLDEEVQERDSSGLCDVSYTTLGLRNILKQKRNCVENGLPPRNEQKNPAFGVKLRSQRNSTYELSQSLLPSAVYDQELHEMVLVANPDVGTTVESDRVLERLPDTVELNPVQAKTLRDAVFLMEPEYKEDSLSLQMEPAACVDSACPSLEEVVEEKREALENSNLGTVKSALAFLDLVPLVREARAEDLSKLLKSPRNRQIKPQLCNILGSASTAAAHQAAKKILRQDEDGGDTERYLWALSMSTDPNPDIAKDVLKRSEETIGNEKVSETLALTAAAMARRHGNPTLVEKTRHSLELGLESCTGEDCKLKFLRALRNLKSKEAIPTLLEHAVNGSKAIGIAAWRALNALPRTQVTQEVKRAAARAFYQIGPRRDSTVRTQALDIILESDPSLEDIRGLLQYLSLLDKAYEVRKYLTQRMDQIAEECPRFSALLREAYKAEFGRIGNYNVLALKGLSTAFTRTFLRSPGSNGSLVTVQEINAGLLKQGIVDVVFETNQEKQRLFSLGYFARGALVSISLDTEDEVEDEVVTAGMEIALLGVGVRPFVFFSGQGELMGHVWSGTASERTPAFQALAGLHRYKEVVPLAAGFLAEVEVEGATSFDLSGQIQLSLWSRTSQSLVETGAGVAVRGGTKVRSRFVHSTAEFTLTTEPKLLLATDVDFSGANFAICMKLTQPETIVRHRVYKVERIPGSRHRLRKVRRSRMASPARSYLLNKKNNEMCSRLFS
ncbi:microsomal triglyceride transfer protein large subunit [Orussus abietinus]|uniref:microsomal triglyceride transfer protein large subunit n=1 Tax=Orussus abietinus TaxID=222816 RepID=UPI00062682CF|nr:microsomal triglyceride transfer protein large subunit [Orussus abietinus]